MKEGEKRKGGKSPVSGWDAATGLASWASAVVEFVTVVDVTAPPPEELGGNTCMPEKAAEPPPAFENSQLSRPPPLLE